MNAEFNWWLLIVGLVVGAGLVWLVVTDSRRREADVDELERTGEAQWIAEAMTDAGRRINAADALDVLRLHAAYLAAAPPDDPFDDAIGDARAADDERRVAGSPAHASAAEPQIAADRRAMTPPGRPEWPDRGGGPA